MTEQTITSDPELTKMWTQRAKQLARKPEIAIKGHTLKILIFRLGPERYGILVANVQEVYSHFQITPVPRTPNFVRGIFSARGKILSVIDLGAFLGFKPRQYDEHARIIVVSNISRRSQGTALELGIFADEVEDVITLLEDDLEPSLPTDNQRTHNYVRGITNQLLELLDLDVLLNDSRLIINDEL